MKIPKLQYCLILLLFSTIVFSQVPDSLARLFDYNPIKQQYKNDSTFIKKNAKGERITYLGPGAFVTSAYLVYPEIINDGKSPLILFQHSGEGNKNEFLDEDLDFAAKGFVCILPDGPWLCPDTPIKSFKRQGFDMYRQCALNVRSAIDLAQEHFDIDSTKIFYVGHSFGCNVGVNLTAVENRIRFFVFMAGTPSTTKYIAQSTFRDFVEWRNTEPEKFKQWLKAMRPLDGELYMGYKTVPCLIQTAKNDEFISGEENKIFTELMPDPKTSKQYEATHALNSEAKRDRQIWITLGI